MGKDVNNNCSITEKVNAALRTMRFSPCSDITAKDGTLKAVLHREYDDIVIVVEKMGQAFLHFENCKYGDYPQTGKCGLFDRIWYGSVTAGDLKAAIEVLRQTKKE